jgi:hypothetical protein
VASRVPKRGGKQAAPQREAIADRTGVFLVIGIRSDGLRIEVVQIRVLECMRCEMKRGGNTILRSDKRVELGEGVERLRAALVDRKGQCTNLCLVDEVFRTFREEKAISDERTANVEPRRGVAQAFEVSAADAEVGQRIVEAVVPFVSAGPRLCADHARGEASVLSQVGRLQDL